MSAAPQQERLPGEWSPPPIEEVRRRLDQHLRTWLGAWPPEGECQVVGSEQRIVPGWDGAIHRVIGVASPEGTVVSVPPDLAESLEAGGHCGYEAVSELGMMLGVPTGDLPRGVFRWSEAPVDLPDAGIWLQADDPRLPPWLVPFNGGVLAALDEDDRYMAGVGIKRHDDVGWEIAVGTDPAYRGRGLARQLVTQAARRVLDEGAVPTYLHAPDNIGSARVAEAAGFPDRGWQILGF